MDGQMPEDDTPQSGTVDGGGVADQQPIDRLADILDDPDDTDTREDEVRADEAPDDDIDDGEEAEDDDAPDGDASEDSDDDDPDSADDGSEDLKGGRFAPHSAKVRLPDGQTTTVEELMKGTLRQSDYTQKTQAISREREEVKAERERVNQASQELSQQRELVDAMLEQWQPKPPENAREDPVAYIEYQQQLEAWNQWQSHLKGQMAETRDKAQAEQREAIQKHLEQENERLNQAIPAMRDPDKRRRIFDELVRFGTDEYGFSREEIGQIADHRMVKVLFDLQRAKARSAKAPEIRDKVSKKPKVMRGSKRGGQAGNSAKRASIERLRETGSARDAERALMNLDL